MFKPLSFLLILFCFNQAFSCSTSAIPPQVCYDFPTYITSLGYPYEQHTVTTDDGYKLTYFRIQSGNSIKSGLPVILLHHGLLDSADSMIINDPDQAPALIFANLGYDLWLGNSRGNVYGLGHTTYDSSDSNSPFWNFSWQEMSQYDLPAGMRYIAQETGQNKIDFVGHSQGNLIMFAALAKRDPTVLQYLHRFFALAPVAYVRNSTSPIVQIGGLIQTGSLNFVGSNLLQNKKFGFQSDQQKETEALACEVALVACTTRLALLSNWRPSVDNTNLLVITQGHFPAGTSAQNLYYYNQMYDNGKDFKEYDYGKAGNDAAYDSDTPPLIDLSQIQEKVYMYAGQYDELASPADTAALRDQLPNREYNIYPLGHSSFVYGKNVAGTYMKDLIAVLKS